MSVNDNFQNRRFFNSKSAALKAISEALNSANIVRIATAYFDISGYQVLQDILLGKELRLLVGREQGGRDNITDVLNEIANEISFGSQERRTRAMRLMLDALEKGLMAVVVSEELPDTATQMDARYIYHHAKLYIADKSATVVTSANLSHHGLITSREAGITVSDTDDVFFFVQRFDHYFEKAQSITNELIEKLQYYLKQYDPYTIYAKALIEIYGLPSDAPPPTLPPLAQYQRAIVSSVLNSIETHKGAFLVASTGLGKTIIAAHTVAYLRMQNEIDNVIVVCPAGLKEMWRRQIKSARTASVEFSYHTLSGNDKKSDYQIGILEHELRNVNESTLVILDESHNLRNQETDGELRLSSERIKKAVQEKGTRILLMTATPYSKSLEDVNNQLGLLPKPNTQQVTQMGFSVDAKRWTIQHLNNLPELAPCTVLTTPDVVRHFGKTDETGEKYVEFSKENKRYFPRHLRLNTVLYKNPLDDFLVELLQSKLLHKNRSQEDTQQIELFDSLDDDLLIGSRDPLLETNIIHQFCSSTARVKILFDNLEKGNFNFTFANQKELSEFIKNRQRELKRAINTKNDEKLQKLIEIVKSANERKIVVFCHYIETAKKIKEGLSKQIRGIKVETTAEKRNNDLDQILQSFAPVANEVPLEDRKPEKELQVLVATGALTEGFNLQDSTILVNYDLPWTVLQLAQRMGRILRPWSEPREIDIYNFIPSTMGDERLRLARNWRKRLHERSEQHRSFAQIPLLIKQDIGHKQEESFQMEQLARELYLYNANENLELEEVLEFIKNSDNLTTSSFYNDLAMIPNHDEVLYLPAGIRSARTIRGNKKQLFILFKQNKKQVQALLFDARGQIMEDGEKREVAINTIRCERNEPKAPANLYPDDDEFDQWIEISRKNWATQQGIDPQKLQIICAMALIPN